MNKVVRNIRRVDPAIVKGYESLSVATVHEAQGRKGLLAPYMRPVWKRAHIAGPAVTVEVAPCDNWMLHVAVEQCKKGDILVATPGRLLDLAGRRLADLSGVQHLVLDEADRMLDMGFIHDVKKVLALVPQGKQSLLFSATFSNEIRELATGLLHDLPRRSCNEGRTVEGDLGRVLALHANAVGRDDRHEVGRGMSAHHRLPVRHRIIAGVRWLAADGGRVEQEFGTGQYQRACCLGEPLVPADRKAQPAESGLDSVKAAVTG
mgnify:CR=1 FL=1